MDLLTLLMFVAGLGLLLAGAGALVRGASDLATSLGVSPLVVGLTVVAFGTSAPELGVSVAAAVEGRPDLAYGNVVGSNIFNVLVILGLSALVTPLAIARQLVRVDVPVMIGLSLLLWFFALDGVVSRAEGVGFVVLFAGYTALQVRLGRNGKPPEPQRHQPLSPALQFLAIAGGLALLVLGSHWLVTGAVALARALGVSELMIGLTIVAAGTSLPEVATSLVAALRGQRDLAVGNVVGSNVFNIAAVLGLSALAAPGGVTVSPQALGFDTPIMVAAAAACLPVFVTGARMARWHGAVFLSAYAAYVAFLVLQATGHAGLPAFRGIMTMFVLPVVAVAILGAALVENSRPSLARRGPVPDAAVARSRPRR